MNHILYKITEPKLRASYFKTIVDESLTKRPYVRVVALTLLEDPSLNENGGKADFARVAKTCLKNLSSEDLMILGNAQRDKMTEFERRYHGVDLNGAKLENELAKIVYRYAREGRPESLAPIFEEQKK